MADVVDESEFWIDSDDEEQYGQKTAETSADPTFFQLDLGRVGQRGDFRTRNTPGQKQRETVTGYRSGFKKRPAFFVGCVAKAIIHGTLNRTSGTRATLLVYDFSFFSYRSVRFKEANIHLEFRSKDGIAGAGPLVHKIAPFATHTMMQTTATVKYTGELSGGLSGGAVVNVQAGAKYGKTVEKTETYGAEVTGNRPPAQQREVCSEPCLTRQVVSLQMCGQVPYPAPIIVV